MSAGVAWAICTLDGRLVDADEGYRELVGFEPDADVAGFDFVQAGVITRRQLAELDELLLAGGVDEPAYPFQRLDGTVALAEVHLEPVDLGSDQRGYAARIRTLDAPKSSLRDVVRRECFAALRAVLHRSRA